MLTLYYTRLCERPAGLRLAAKKHVSITIISITNEGKLHIIKHMLFLYMSGNARSSGHCVV
jgi:hypothetical protein